MRRNRFQIRFPYNSNLRERISLGAAVGLTLLPAFMPWGPKVDPVTGLEIFRGHLVPNWVTGGYLFVSLLWFNSLAYWLLGFTRIGMETIRIQGKNIHPMRDGGVVGWVPEDPSDTSTPFDYEPPNFNDQTTAEEFFNTDPPNPMRGLIGAPDNELFEFLDAQEAWVRTAPEPTIDDLLALARSTLIGKGVRRMEAGHALLMIYDERGKPPLAELRELAEAAQDQGLLAQVVRREAASHADE